MATRVTLFLICFISITSSLQAQTWNEWFKQKKTQKKYLLLQIAKLQVLLGSVKKGYRIVDKGLTLIGDFKRGNLNMHDGYFNHLKNVSPTVSGYDKVQAILDMQEQLLRLYKKRMPAIRTSENLAARQRNDCLRVADAIMDAVDGDLLHLKTILQSGEFQMTDYERIGQIDQVYNRVSTKKSAFQHLLDDTFTLMTSRQLKIQALRNMQDLY